MIVPIPTFLPKGFISSSFILFLWYECNSDILPFVLNIPITIKTNPRKAFSLSGVSLVNFFIRYFKILPNI